MRLHSDIKCIKQNIINKIMMITNLGQWTFIKRLFIRYSRPKKKSSTKNPNKIYTYIVYTIHITF